VSEPIAAKVDVECSFQGSKVRLTVERFVELVEASMKRREVVSAEPAFEGSSNRPAID
jgi:hypothetical protein